VQLDTEIKPYTEQLRDAAQQAYTLLEEFVLYRDEHHLDDAMNLLRQKFNISKVRGY
jgi:hypothetical protein